MKKLLLMALTLSALGLSACNSGTTASGFKKLEYNETININIESKSTIFDYTKNELNKYNACYRVFYISDNSQTYTSGQYENKLIYYYDDMKNDTLTIKIDNVIKITFKGTFYYLIRTSQNEI